SKLPIDEQALQTVWDALYAVSTMLRGVVPTRLCPWCKGQDGVQQECAACKGNGYTPADVKDEDVPRELLETKKPRVAIKGKYVLVSELDPEGERPEENVFA